jgi:pilus assembly protein CpaB
MVLRSFLITLMALGFAGFLGVGWVAIHPPVPVVADVVPVAALPPAPRPHIMILAAARPLRAGTLLSIDDMAPHDTEALAPDVLSDTPAAREALAGGMIRHNLPAGALLRPDTILRSMDRGFLAAVLAPGMLAVSIGVDPVSGAAGLIWPGDRVDVLLTQTIETPQTSPAHRASGEIMLTNVRVIAIDQLLMQGAVGSDAADRATRTVTLEVTAAQSARIAVALRIGKLSLAVHAALAAPLSMVAVPPAVTWAGDVSAALETAKAPDSLRVFLGPDKVEEMHF